MFFILIAKLLRRRNILNGHKSKVIWFTGLSGAGKSTLAKGLENKLYKEGNKNLYFRW